MKQDITIELFYSAAWQDHTSDVYARNDIQIVCGRGSESATTPPAHASLQFDNRDGTFNPTNPNSPLYGLVGRNTPIRITVDTSVRFVGEVSSWTPRRGVHDNDQWTDVEAAGITRRLGQGTPPVLSALAGHIPTIDPVGYWPMEDGPGSTQFASGISGGRPATLVRSGFAYAQQTDLPGSAPLPLSDFGAGIFTRAFGDILGSTTAADAWTVMFWFKGPITDTPTLQQVTIGQVNIYMADTDDFAQWVMVLTNTYNAVASDSETVAVYAENDAGTTVADASLNAGAVETVGDHYTEWRFVRVVGDQPSGTLHRVRIWLDEELVASHTSSSSGYTVGRPVRARMAMTATSDTETKASIGHVAVFDYDASDEAADVFAAGYGFPGELAEDRFTRLASQYGITPITVVGVEGDTLPLGIQAPHTLPELLAEIEATDGGFIFDTRDDAGLTMRGGRAQYNQTPVLELTYGDDVAPPLDPVVDDRDTRNDATASRPGGSSARAEDAASIAAVGRVPTRVDVNPQSDLDLPNHAQWAVHLGTVEGARYPQVSVDLTAAGASLIELADAMDVGYLLTIDDLEPDRVELIVVGYTEVIGSHRRRITFGCVPAEPYRIADPEGATNGRVGFSSLWRRSGAITTVQTGLTLRNEEGPDVTYESDFDIEIGGERMTVTAIGAWSGTYPNRSAVFTVVRSVNGVVKAHPVNSQARLAERNYIGL